MTSITGQPVLKRWANFSRVRNSVARCDGPVWRDEALKNPGTTSLITTRKVGRFKYHYLNPVPIQKIADHWISRFSKSWIRGLTNIKTALEKENIMVAKPKHVYVTSIKTTPEKLWAALTDPKLTVQYFFAHRLQSTLKTGADFNYLDTDNKIMLRGKVMEASQPKKNS